MDCSLPSSSVHGIFQTRILEWVAISFSGVFSLLGTEPGSPAVQTDSLPTELLGKSQKSFSRVQLFVTSWTIQSMEFTRPEYWSGQPFPSQETFPTQGLNPGLPHYRQIFTSWTTREGVGILQIPVHLSPGERPLNRTKRSEKGLRFLRKQG